MTNGIEIVDHSASCEACGVAIEPSQEQVDQAVDQVLQLSLSDARKMGGVCPLCGHSKQDRTWHRKTVLAGLLLACLVAFAAILLEARQHRATERAAVVTAAMAELRSSPVITQLLGAPLSLEPGMTGSVTHDETGWREAHLAFIVRGPKGEAYVSVLGSSSSGAWSFTTFDVIVEKQRQKLDLVSHRTVVYDPAAYVDVHTALATPPQYLRALPPPPQRDGGFPCIFANGDEYVAQPSFGRCSTLAERTGAVDRFEIDLRSGSLIVRQTDLHVHDVFDVPLTRAYRSDDWLGENRSHAFGVNSNHLYDMAPLGSRNPYTYQVLTLEDGDSLYFERISKGTGYADAVYQHTETPTGFYKATTSWNGHGWTTRLSDGSEIEFPESYNAKNLAQGAATTIRNASGEELHLNRDPQRNLQEILTPHGQWIRFHYDDQSRITRAEDSAGVWANYTYNSDGMLISANNSTGSKRSYQYQGLLLTAVADETGHLLLRNWYSSGVVVRQMFANGDVFTYRYQWNAKRTYAERVYVTRPDGTEQQISTLADVSGNLREQ